MPKVLKNTYIICLGQFVVSGMFDSSEKWTKTKELIEITAKNGLAIYPMPLEHIMETAEKFEDSAKGQHKSFSAISQGYYFKHPAEITAQLLVSSVRRNNITFNTFIKRAYPTNRFEDSLKTIRENNGKYQRMISQRTMSVNYIRSNTNQKNISKSVADRMIAAIVSTNTNELFGRMKYLVLKGGIITIGVPFKDQQVPH